MSDLAQRLRDGADRFLKWAHKQQYSGPPVISIPVHEGNIDCLMGEAANLIEWQAAEIVELRSALATAREEGFRAGRLAGLEEAETKIADLNAQASSAWTNPTLADQAYIEGRAECVEIIRALKAKQP